MKTKTCTKCGIEKSLTEFYKQKTVKSGRRASCKECCDKYTMDRYNNDEQHKQGMLGQSKQWSKDNPERVRENNRKSYHKDHEKSKERNRHNSLKWKKDSCTSGIYIIKNLKENKVYIGESYAIENRWHSHRSALKKNNRVNKKLKQDWDRLGEESFEFEVLTDLSGSSKIERLIEEEKTIIKYEKLGYEIYNNPNSRNDYKEENNEVHFRTRRDNRRGKTHNACVQNSKYTGKNFYI